MIHCFRQDNDAITAYYNVGFSFAESEDQAEEATLDTIGYRSYPPSEGFYGHTAEALTLRPEIYEYMLQVYGLSDGLELWRDI